MSAKLGEILLKQNLITPQQLKEALDYQKVNGGRLGSTLVKLGFLSEEEVTAVLSKQYGVPSVNLESFEVDPAAVALVPRETAERYMVLPLSRVGSTLTLAMVDPTNVFAIDDIKFMTGLQIEPVVVSEGALLAALDKYYGTTREIELAQIMEGLVAETTSKEYGEDLDLEVSEDEDEIDIENLEKMAGDAPVVKLANVILVDALRRGASDIHIEPYERELRVRFRLDGVLHNIMNPPLKLRDALTSRIKIMARLDIAEKRLPQDGRIKVKVKLDGRSRELDLRVSTLPTIHGEKIVMRLLDKENLRLDLTQLGFEPESLERFKRNIEKPYGMVLVTGPTGSGKTSTLYSALQTLNTPDTNIMTAEDPVEYQLPGINQVQVKESIGLNFAAALRAFLRQDPNIIMVGEIRDFETAEIAVKAALTGHLVLSTLHTNDAPSTVSRLMNMGIEPFLVATSVNLIQAQRLVRRICKECKTEVHTPIEVLVDLGFSASEAKQIKIYRGMGCQACNNTGYKGRIGLYEVMEISESLREMIMVGATALELKRKAIEEGMITLRQSGLEKIRQGLTTIEEVLRETVK